MKIEVGDYFRYYDNVYVMYLGQDEDFEYVHYISIFFNTALKEERLQCSFAPIHKDFLDELNKIEYMGHGTPDQPTLEESKKLWTDYNEGDKSWFTVPINKIIEIFLALIHKAGLRIAPIFPVMKKPDDLEEV